MQYLDFKDCSGRITYLWGSNLWQDLNDSISLLFWHSNSRSSRRCKSRNCRRVSSDKWRRQSHQLRLWTTWTGALIRSYILTCYGMMMMMHRTSWNKMWRLEGEIWRTRNSRMSSWKEIGRQGLVLGRMERKETPMGRMRWYMMRVWEKRTPCGVERGWGVKGRLGAMREKSGRCRIRNIENCSHCGWRRIRGICNPTLQWLLYLMLVQFTRFPFILSTF